MPKVEGVYVAVTKEDDNWYVHIVNDNNNPIENVLINSKGYLIDIEGEKETSSTLRHFIKVVSAKSSSKIEPIIEDVFKLNNEYLVSYYMEGKLYDKKFIFLPETIKESNFSTVPVIDKKGVWIK